MKPIYLLVLYLLLVGCSQQRPPEVREFPDGFHGWALIVWEVPGYPELPSDTGKIVERFPADGLIITSSKQNFGWARDEEYYLDEEGHRLSSLPHIALEHLGRRENNAGCCMYFSELFVGTDAEAEHAKGKRSDDDVLYRRICPDTKLR
ncbi:MAG TPA: hypothetical protein VMJ32_03490 [Pirellulales bacterium]|nr:hypothetical protein [Pirellulales bacterium]